MGKQIDLIDGLQPASWETWNDKYRLKDSRGNPVDADVDAMRRRVARALADVEKKGKRDYWYEKFYQIMKNGATPAGRILSNAGAWEFKPATSLINCTVSETVEDSMKGILHANSESGVTLSAGCGIGYEFSTLRPKGAFVKGAGAFTSGPLSFMDIFDKMCFTVSSAGGRRGAQMATFAVWHPDIEDYIAAKRENGRLRQFNMSILLNDEFMTAVREDGDWDLVFPSKKSHQRDVDGRYDWMKNPWDEDYSERMGYEIKDGMIKVLVYRTVKARDLWDKIMKSTYDFAEPGILFIDKINNENNNWFTENIRATNPCLTGDTEIRAKVDGKKGRYFLKDLVEVFSSGKKIEVHSVDTKKGISEFMPVTNALLTKKDAELIKITLEGGQVLRLTPDHKVYTKNRGYVQAKDLTEEDELVTSYELAPEVEW